jgi:hypothetical protein
MGLEELCVLLRKYGALDNPDVECKAAGGVVCARCRYDNEVTARFCLECGQALPLTAHNDAQESQRPIVKRQNAVSRVPPGHCIICEKKVEGPFVPIPGAWLLCRRLCGLFRVCACPPIGRALSWISMFPYRRAINLDAFAR